MKTSKILELRISKIMSPITLDVDKLLDDYNSEKNPPPLSQLNFSSGDGYIQHIPEVFERIQKEFLDLCYEVLGDKVYLNSKLGGKIHRQGIVGRYIEDTVFSKYWYIFHCTDDEHRQWGQPYFELN